MQQWEQMGWEVKNSTKNEFRIEGYIVTLIIGIVVVVLVLQPPGFDARTFTFTICFAFRLSIQI